MNSKQSPLTTSFAEHEEIYHPNSYYIRGGIDITGRALELSATPKYDDESSCSGEIQAAACCNPRENFLDIVEKIGFDEAQAVIAEAQLKAQTEKHTNE